MVIREHPISTYALVTQRMQTDKGRKITAFKYILNGSPLMVVNEDDIIGPRLPNRLTISPRSNTPSKIIKKGICRVVQKKRASLTSFDSPCSCYLYRSFTPPSSHLWICIIITQCLWVIWGQCCPRVAAAPSLPNGPITQLSPYFAQKPGKSSSVGNIIGSPPSLPPSLFVLLPTCLQHKIGDTAKSV